MYSYIYFVNKICFVNKIVFLNVKKKKQHFIIPYLQTVSVLRF